MAPAVEAGAGSPARALVLAALAFLLTAPAAALGAKTTPEGPLSEIRIVGLVTVPEEKVRREIQSRVGRAWSRDVIEGDLKRLTKMQWFSEIKPYIDRDPKGEGVILTFHVREMPIIREVEFRGRNKVRLKDIETTTGLKAGGRADPMRAQMAVAQIKNLYEEKGYGLTEVRLLEGGRQGDTKVVFEIYEGPWVKLGAIDFVGNTIVSDALLRTKITSKTPILTFGGSYRRDDVDADARKLVDYYNGMGYLEAKVDSYTESGSTVGDRRLTFVISEGIQYKVRNITFQGNERLTDAQIKEMLVLHSGQPFNDSVREADLKKLNEKYSSLGCIDIQVRDERKYTDQPGIIDIAYEIQEGQMYRVGEITVAGNQRTRDKVVRRELLMAGLVPGQPLDGKRLEAAKKRLQSLGFFQANPEMGKALELKIVHRRPGNQPYAPEDAAPMDEILRTRFQNAPEDELGPLPGVPPATPPAPIQEAPAQGRDGPAPFGGNEVGPFDPAPGQLPAINAPALPPAGAVPVAPAPGPGPGPVRGPIRQPIDTGVPPGTFPSLPGTNANDVGPDRQEAFPDRAPMDIVNSVEPGPGTNDRAYADLQANVEEGPTGNFMLGVSASSFQGLNGNLIIHEKNFDITNLPRSFSQLTSGQAFRGAGQDLRIEISPGTLINRATVSFREPYLFNLPIGLNTSGYAFTRIYPDFNERRVGGRFSLGRQLGAQTYVDAAFRVEDVNINGFRTPAPADFLAASGHSLLASLRPSIRFDNRNDPMAPNKGQYLEFAFEQGWGTFTFPKVTIEGKQYFTLGSRPDGSGKRILTLRGTYGVTGRDTPLYERFFAGDFGSMRGFAFRGVGPHVLGVNVGGVMRAIGSVEYQIPLVASDKIQQVFFCDFGTVQSDYSFSGDTFRGAVGTGLRLQIPALGPMPLAFDIAFPFAKVQGDKTRYFTFFIGTFW